MAADSPKIVALCGACRAKLKISRKRLGEVVTCPACGKAAATVGEEGEVRPGLPREGRAVPVGSQPAADGFRLADEPVVPKKEVPKEWVEREVSDEDFEQMHAEIHGKNQEHNEAESHANQQHRTTWAGPLIEAIWAFFFIDTLIRIISVSNLIDKSKTVFQENTGASLGIMWAVLEFCLCYSAVSIVNEYRTVAKRPRHQYPENNWRLVFGIAILVIFFGFFKNTRGF